MTVKTPTFTTATACKRALTGVGATIAAGSHEWKGIIAAFAIPAMNNIKVIVRKVSLTPIAVVAIKMPLSEKSSVPATVYVMNIANNRNAMDVPRRYVRYIL